MADLFKEIIPSILQTKKNVVENEKDYVPFVVNKALSFHYDCVLIANEMNKVPNTDGILQYHFLLNKVRGYKRPFQKWHKRETIEDLDAIKEYYNYSNDKAKEALTVLSNDQINDIKSKLNKGGLNDKHKRTNRGDANRA
tara:strand:- start:187 stop:606 length:420 start_codon:yes stop_codon:yes gene_type:complete